VRDPETADVPGKRRGYSAAAHGASTVPGARAPSILTSRAGTVVARMASRAVALIGRATRRERRAGTDAILVLNAGSSSRIRLDGAATLVGAPRITTADTADSPVSVWVVPTDEEVMIAAHALACIRI
jgi:hypothetical protein